MLDRSKRNRERRNKPSTTDVTLLLDMSGSMQIRREETIREVNRYLDQLKSDGQKYRLTVKTFNEGVDTLLNGRNIQDVGDLEHSEYRPNGWTALLDAVGDTLNRAYRYGDRVLFVVITDGEENASRRYGLSEVRDMIDRKRSEDFQFVFLGDGPGSWQVGRQLGFQWSVSTDYSNPENTKNIYRGLYAASNSLSTGGTISASMLNTSSTSAQATAKICTCLGIPNNTNDSCPLHGLQ